MKKTLLIILAVSIAVTACEKNTYVDGDYSATFNERSDDGWNTVLKFSLTDDVISDVDYDDFDIHGNRKSKDSAYNAEMHNAVGTSPAVFMPLIASAITLTSIIPSYEPIDTLRGAAVYFENANILMEAALEAALVGEPTDIEIPRPTE